MFRISRTRLVAGLATAAAIVPAGSAVAADDTVTVGITGATAPVLTTAPDYGNFGFELDGTRQSVSTSIAPWKVTDATGSGLGWRVNVKATLPPELTGSALSMTTATPTPDDALNGSAAPTSSSGSILAAGGRQVATTIADGGMGIWNFTQTANDLTLIVPPNVKAGGPYDIAITTTLSPGLGA
jgi:hypothetical protein